MGQEMELARARNSELEKEVRYAADYSLDEG
jgi:hypothetical protein